jgi:hypothetical protein
LALGRNRTRDPRVPEPKRTPLGCILPQYFFTILEVSLDWKSKEVVLSRGYGHIQQSIVRAEVFAGKIKSTHSVAVIPTL